MGRITGCLNAHGGVWVHCLEVGGVIANSLTSVTKDCMILEIYESEDKTGNEERLH